MIPDSVFVIFIVSIVYVVAIMATTMRAHKVRLIHKEYFIGAAFMAVWMVALIFTRYTDPGNIQLLQIWDSVMYLGGAYSPVFALIIALTFIHSLDKFPKRYLWLFIVPTITNIMAWTCLLYTSRCV